MACIISQLEVIIKRTATQLTAQQVNVTEHMEHLEDMMFNMMRSLNDVCDIVGVLVDGRDQDYVQRP